MGLLEMLIKKLFGMFLGGAASPAGSAESGAKGSMLSEMFKQILAGAAGGGLGGSATGQTGGAGQGGLGSLIEAFKQKGMGDLASSWVGKGKNMPVNVDQIKDVLGSDRLRQLGEQFGMSGDKVSEMLSKHLPQMVDQATPDGRLPDESDEEESNDDRPLELPGPR